VRAFSLAKTVGQPGLDPQGLCLAYTAVTVWLFASLILSLMPTANGAGVPPSSATQVVRGLFDGVIAAVTLPGMFLVILRIVAGRHQCPGRPPPESGTTLHPPAAPRGYGPGWWTAATKFCTLVDPPLDHG
jgi:hypothetical protein